MATEIYILCDRCGGEATRQVTTRKREKESGRYEQTQIFVCNSCGKKHTKQVLRRDKDKSPQGIV